MYLEKMKIGEKTIISQSDYAPLSDETKSKFTYKSIGNNLAELTRTSKRYKTDSVRSMVFERLSVAELEKVTFENIDTVTLRVYVSAYNRKHNDVFVVKDTFVCRDIDKAMNLSVLTEKMYDLIEMSIYNRMKDLQYKIVDFNIMSPLPFEGIKDKVKQFEESKRNEVIEVAPEIIKESERIKKVVELIESDISEMEFTEDENEFED
jgi:hypothetical protein